MLNYYDVFNFCRDHFFDNLVLDRLRDKAPNSHPGGPIIKEETKEVLGVFLELELEATFFGDNRGNKGVKEVLCKDGILN